MSSWSDSLSNSMDNILNINWDSRNGSVVPEAANVKIKDGAVRIEAAFLYADLAGSSKLSKLCPWQTTAKIIRAYLDCCTRSIRVHQGHIRSFDGDRVMGIFIGQTPCTDAIMCAREIDWMVHNKLNPKAKSKFRSIENNGIKIKHCIGIDYGEVHAVRAGIRDSNDLIWIGKPSSFAAKLSDIRSYPNEVYISAKCYNKGVGDDKKNLWTRDTTPFAGESYYVYKTSTPLEP